MPRADDFCDFVLGENEVPTELNPLGVKGAGESGTVGALASLMNAINDAMAHIGAELRADAGDAGEAVAGDRESAENVGCRWPPSRPRKSGLARLAHLLMRNPGRPGFRGGGSAGAAKLRWTAWGDYACSVPAAAPRP